MFKRKQVEADNFFDKMAIDRFGSRSVIHRKELDALAEIRRSQRDAEGQRLELRDGVLTRVDRPT